MFSYKMRAAPWSKQVQQMSKCTLDLNASEVDVDEGAPAFQIRKRNVYALLESPPAQEQAKYG